MIQQLFVNLIQESIDILRQYEPPEGYYLAFSGGKDSCVLKRLADMAGVKYDAHYSVVTVDPPELVRFIRQNYSDVKFEIGTTMWKRIASDSMPPTGRMRYCCESLKENGGSGRIVLTGIRAEESARRAKKWSVWQRLENRSVINPIFHWNEADVWEFIENEKLPYCELYDQGYGRLGCIACPMAPLKKRISDLEQYPKFRTAYIRAFERMLARRRERGLETTWETGEQVMEWWLSI